MTPPAIASPGTNLPHANAVQTTGVVVEQVELAHDTYRQRIACPEIAQRIVPGQFFMLKPGGSTDPLLGRPFALYDVYRDAAGNVAGFDFGYHVVGKLTGQMRDWQGGEPVELWGPLGNGFPISPVGPLLCVGGGIGYTPFLAVAREAAGVAVYGDPPRTAARQEPRPPGGGVTLLYGVRSRPHRADLSDFDGIPGFRTRIATDDGSEGHHGFVTDLLREELSARPPAAVYCCGPEPMMAAVARICREYGVACWLSLESPMACGFGACFSCVTRVVTNEPPGWDYRRTCIEGPVFRSDALLLGT
ncbi:MAG: dihydroorotate dehydrogenase electron transfer subunit [Planctomycetaceae bacterium]|nr:dihydroorotate dehydrogenase electron transfer subunit [Planctomycetaceae bacterium]